MLSCFKRRRFRRFALFFLAVKLALWLLVLVFFIYPSVSESHQAIGTAHELATSMENHLRRLIGRGVRRQAAQLVGEGGKMGEGPRFIQPPSADSDPTQHGGRGAESHPAPSSPPAPPRPPPSPPTKEVKPKNKKQNKHHQQEKGPAAPPGGEKRGLLNNFRVRVRLSSSSSPRSDPAYSTDSEQIGENNDKYSIFSITGFLRKIGEIVFYSLGGKDPMDGWPAATRAGAPPTPSEPGNARGLDGPILLDPPESFIYNDKRPKWSYEEFLEREKTEALFDGRGGEEEPKWDIVVSMLHAYFKALQGAAGPRATLPLGGGGDAEVVHKEWTDLMENVPPYPEGGFRGRGIVIPGGGLKYILTLYVNIRLLRYVGCRLPIELWMLEAERPGKELEGLLSAQGVSIRHTGEAGLGDPSAPPGWGFLGGRRGRGGEGETLDLRKLVGGRGFAFKAAALVLSSFEEVLLLDSDVNALLDPSPLFDFPPYLDAGAVLWQDYWKQKPADFDEARAVFALRPRDISLWSGGNSGLYPGAYKDSYYPPQMRFENGTEREVRFQANEFTLERVRFEHHNMSETIHTHDSGVILVNKRKTWRTLLFYLYMNFRPEVFHKVTIPNSIGLGDKETLPMALRVLRRPYYLVEAPPGVGGRDDLGHTMVQYWPNTTRALFLHRNCLKWRPGLVGGPRRAWEQVAHVPPSLSTRAGSAVDGVFWRCSVEGKRRGFVRQPFEDAVPFPVESVASAFASELLQSGAYGRYSKKQAATKSRGLVHGQALGIHPLHPHSPSQAQDRPIGAQTIPSSSNNLLDPALKDAAGAAGVSEPAAGSGPLARGTEGGTGTVSSSDMSDSNSGAGAASGIIKEIKSGGGLESQGVDGGATSDGAAGVSGAAAGLVESISDPDSDSAAGTRNQNQNQDQHSDPGADQAASPVPAASPLGLGLASNSRGGNPRLTASVRARRAAAAGGGRGRHGHGHGAGAEGGGGAV